MKVVFFVAQWSDYADNLRRQWKAEDLVALLPEPKAKKRGPYKKRISN